MPLVLLLNRPGNRTSNSGKRLLRSSRVCSAATPLTLCEATTQRYDMRTILPPFSSIREQARFFWLSPGHWRSQASINCALMS